MLNDLNVGITYFQGCTAYYLGQGRCLNGNLLIIINVDQLRWKCNIYVCVYLRFYTIIIFFVIAFRTGHILPLDNRPKCIAYIAGLYQVILSPYFEITIFHIII